MPIPAPFEAVPTVAEVRATLSPVFARALGADGVAAELALGKALRWLAGRCIRHGRPMFDFRAEYVDTGDAAADLARFEHAKTVAEIAHDAVVKRAEYELWARSERESVARDKRADADDLIEGLFGGQYDAGAGTGEGGTGGRMPTAAAAVVAPPKRSDLVDAVAGRPRLPKRFGTFL